MKTFKDIILENLFNNYKDFSKWEKECKRLKYKVMLGTHPNGDTNKYYKAKDKEGNDRGFFDLIKNVGKIEEPKY